MYKVAVDVGGTFTDVLAIDDHGEMVMVKTPSTPEDPSLGVLDGLRKVSDSLQISFKHFLTQISFLLHGTTVTTNAVLTLNGVKTGLITTKGFRDIIELRRGRRDNVYNFKVPFPAMPVPRYLRMEVEERITYAGEVHIPLNEEDVRRATRKLKEHGMDSIVISFIHSYMNPEHERKAAEIVRKEYPEVYVVEASEVLPQIREYERTSTAVLSGYIGPILSRYIHKMEEELRTWGYKGPLFIMQSNGGIQTLEAINRMAVNTIMSGPSAGPVAGILLAEDDPRGNIISVDMGGTSFDTTLIEGGEILTTSEAWIGDYVMSNLQVEIHSIGAGGGSIAWIDEGSLLRVGPQSAGAVPGPVCYGKGGKKPTVTDADVVLGYISLDNFLGGEMKLEVDAAREIIREEIGRPLKMDLIEASHAIFTLINSAMADGIRTVSTLRGYDPRDFTLVVGGGAGPVHAARIAQELEIPRIIIPKVSSIYCTLGMLGADLKQEYVRTYHTRIGKSTSEKDVERINEIYKEMESQGKKLLRQAGLSEGDIYTVRSVDMRYLRQFHEVNVLVPDGILTKEDLTSTVMERFHEKHDKLYGHFIRHMEGETVNFRTSVRGYIPKPKFIEQTYKGKDTSKALKGRRKVYFAQDGGFIDTPIYDGDELIHGNVLEGPAIVEEKATSVVIPPKFEFQVDKHGNYVGIYKQS